MASLSLVDSATFYGAELRGGCEIDRWMAACSFARSLAPRRRERGAMGLNMASSAGWSRVGREEAAAPPIIETKQISFAPSIVLPPLPPSYPPLQSTSILFLFQVSE